MSATTSYIKDKLETYTESAITQDVVQGLVFLYCIYVICILGVVIYVNSPRIRLNSHIRKLFLSKMGQINHIQK